LVSVIIIFFNTERFIQEAIESVLAQTYQAWELLLVDDGSTDGGTAIAQWYADHGPGQVYYLEHTGHENRGMSASRNLGIRHARGTYITFLDADDVWFPRALQEHVAVLKSWPEAGMVYGPIQWWYGWTGRPEDGERDCHESLGVPPNTLIPPPKLLRLFLQDKAAVPSGIMVHRKVIEKLGAFEDAFRGEYEDQVFCAKICLHEPVFASSQCVYRYRQHPDSCVSLGHATGQTLAARRHFLDWLTSYLSDQGLKDWRLSWVLKQEYWRYSHPRLFYFLRRNRNHWQRMTNLWKSQRSV
jgi:glycosyltransferase involved in cell wall biosynthesis